MLQGIVLLQVIKIRAIKYPLDSELGKASKVELTLQVYTKTWILHKCENVTHQTTMLNIYHNLSNDKHFEIETATKCIPFCSVCGHHIFPEKLILYSTGVENLKQYATTTTKQKQKQRNRIGSNEYICKVLSRPLEHLSFAKNCGLENSLRIITIRNVCFFL